MRALLALGLAAGAAVAWNNARAAEGYWSLAGTLPDVCEDEINAVQYEAFEPLYQHAVACYAREQRCPTRVTTSPELIRVGPPTWQYEFYVERQQGSQCMSGWTGNRGTASFTGEPECPNGSWSPRWGCESPCVQAAGRSFGRHYEDTQTRGAMCITVAEAECRAEPVGVHACLGGLCYGQVKLSGAECVDEPEPGEDETVEPLPASENCISMGGMSVCHRADEKNCGFVNGERWCAPESMREGCISTASGAMVCVGDAGPVDELGELLPADGEFVTGGGAGAGSEPGHDRQWRYYGRDTVAGGSGAVRTSRPSEGDVGEGDGDGEDGEYPDLEDGESWGEATEGFWSQVQDTPWGQALAVSGIPDGGECPTATFDFFGEELTIAAHCDLIEEYSGLLGVVCLFGWALLGVRIVLSA